MTKKQQYIEDYRKFASVLRLMAFANNVSPQIYLDQLDRVCRSAMDFVRSGEK